MNYVRRTLQRKDFSEQNLAGSIFRNCDLSGSDFLNSDLTGADFRDSNLYGCRLEGAILKDVKIDDNTQYYKMHCPEEGAFLGCKKCCGEKIVRLMIPKDAKRTSATQTSCRCDKALVLSVDSLDGKTKYDWASSYVDDEYVYRTGQYSYAKHFNKDRWVESTYGIHFFMTREEAMGYL